LPLEVQGAACADVIQRTLASPERYREMSLAAFQRYRHVLNWDVGVAKLIGLMEQAVTSAKTGDA
jgi:hypothetical protein